MKVIDARTGDGLQERYSEVLRRRRRAVRVAVRYGLPASLDYVRFNLWQLLALGDGKTSLEGYLVVERLVECNLSRAQQKFFATFFQESRQ